MSDTCVVIVGHGSRDPEANAEMAGVVAAFAAAHPDVRVATAFIELAQPLVAEALTAIAPTVRRIVVVPLFLFAAGHVKVDLPLAVAEARHRNPGTHFVLAPCLGVHPAMVALAVERATAFLPTEPPARGRTMLLVVGRGSSDPDANGDFAKVARLIGEGRGLMGVETAHIGVTHPSVDVALERVGRVRPERLVVLPYFLFAGRLIKKLGVFVQSFQQSHPWIATCLAPHLGNDERLVSLLRERTRQAIAGTSTLPCDTCQYRTALPGLPTQVGGLRAMLYSIRHTLTHSQAAVPAHTHRPLKKHVLVCANTDCVDRGSIAVLDTIRRTIKASGRARDIKVTRTSCMGRCGDGPTVAVYPDGIWYQRVARADASEIVIEHLLGDRLVARLVGDILQ